MLRTAIAATLAILISGCSWWDAYLELMAVDYEPTPPSEAEAQAHYNLLNNPPPGCEDDPVCKSDQVWATYRIREYERERRKKEAREHCMRELYSERRARLGIPQCTGE